METPRLDGLKILRPIGAGGCGVVYAALDEKGEKVAVKVFEAISINRGLLAKTTARLATGGWPGGVMPMVSTQLDHRPSYWITPWMGDDAAEKNANRSLQHGLDKHPGSFSRTLVREIAAALASMHERQVAHGNLKPGNVFFDGDGRILLSDWALGNMPGVGHLAFTDALLYQSPEQLTHADAYLEDGYRWDVYSFGAIAFRILTGDFPRCNGLFSEVAPATGETRREGIEADLAEIAGGITQQPVVSWPDDPMDDLDAGLREWIIHCLHLDPLQRPASMREVAAGLDALEARVSAAAERTSLLDQRRHAQQRSRHLLFAVGILSVLVILLGLLWLRSLSRIRHERQEHETKIEEFEAAATTAIDAREVAEKRVATTRHEFESEKELGVARLQATRLTADHLFLWAMENGHRTLPSLDGREWRLQRLEQHLEDFLNRTVHLDGVTNERARAMLQLAEVSIAAGDILKAKTRFSAALAASGSLSEDKGLKLRLATDSLLLALLHQSAGDTQTGAAFTAARQALKEISATDADAGRVSQLKALLDLHEARYLSSKGDDPRALDQLLRATRTLNQLADERPDVATLRSSLASSYLSSAAILEGLGSMAEARDARASAAAEINKLLKKSPGDTALRNDLAGCYSAMAEAAVFSGDTSAAETYNADALKLLDRLVSEQPENLEIATRRAAQLGLRAGLLRDKGNAAEAVRGYENSIQVLETLAVASPSHPAVMYRLAMVRWQKGRMLGMTGKRDQEILLEKNAYDLLKDLENRQLPAGIRPEQIRSSAAYLLGDLGLALQVTGQKAEARQAFVEAVSFWEKLIQWRPESEEYEEGLSWCRQQLKDLESP